MLLQHHLYSLQSPHGLPGHTPQPGPDHCTTSYYPSLPPPTARTRTRTHTPTRPSSVFPYKWHLSPPISFVFLENTHARTSTGAGGRRKRRSIERESESPSSGFRRCWLTNSNIKMALIMVDNYIIGTFFASLLGFVLLYILRRNATTKGNKRRRAGSGLFDDEIPNDCVRSSANGEARPEGGPDVDVIIVGAGVAGAALAHTLGKPGGYLKLVELGIEDCVEEIDAQRVLGYALFKDGRNTKLSYPLEKFHLDVAGRSFHNGRFVQRMRQKAVTLPNVQLDQGTVTSLLEENGIIKGVQYKTKNGQGLKAFAPLTIVCDGCFSNLRRSLCNPMVDVPSCFVGLVLENCELPFPNYGHVILVDPSPILFYPVSSTEIRCLVDIPGQKIPSIANGELANYLKTVVAPQVPPELHDSFIAAIDKGSIRTMPNRSMPAAPYPTPGALLIGDAFNMRHPLTGGGMTGALYKVFCASPDQARKEMREACFDYLSLGGVCSTGPVALLSGLNPSPLSLILHFFAIAIYGVGRLLLPFPSPKRLWIAARLFLGASAIIFPLFLSHGLVPSLSSV